MSALKSVSHPPHIRRTVVALVVALGLLGYRCGLLLAETSQMPVQVQSDPAGRVFGSDDRDIIEDTTSPPWSSIGMVIALFNEDTPNWVASFGTGVLIGTRTVVTSAHVIHEKEYGWSDNITFVPGKNGSDTPFGRIRVVSTDAPQSYTGEKNDDHDIALLILETAVGEQTGYMDVIVQPASFFPGRELNLAGYAGDFGSYGSLSHATGPARDLQGLVIRSELDSGEGQSGGPVWYEEEGGAERHLVGINKGDRTIYEDGVVTDSYSISVHINASVYNWIRETLLANDTVVLPEVIEAESGLACPGAALAKLTFLSLGALLAGRHARR